MFDCLFCVLSEEGDWPRLVCDRVLAKRVTVWRA